MVTDKEILEKLKEVALKQNQEFKKNMEACKKSVSEAFANNQQKGIDQLRGQLDAAGVPRATKEQIKQFIDSLAAQSKKST